MDNEHEYSIGSTYTAEVVELSQYGCIATLHIPSRNRVGFINAARCQKLKGTLSVGDYIRVTVLDIDEKQRADLDIVIS